jgi:hypothetical protein
MIAGAVGDWRERLVSADKAVSVPFARRLETRVVEQATRQRDLKVRVIQAR